MCKNECFCWFLLQKGFRRFKVRFSPWHDKYVILLHAYSQVVYCMRFTFSLLFKYFFPGWGVMLSVLLGTDMVLIWLCIKWISLT